MSVVDVIAVVAVTIALLAMISWQHAMRALIKARDAGEAAERDRQFYWSSICRTIEGLRRFTPKPPALAIETALRYARMFSSLGTDAPSRVVPHDSRVEIEWDDGEYLHTVGFYPDGRTHYDRVRSRSGGEIAA